MSFVRTLKVALSIFLGALVGMAYGDEANVSAWQKIDVAAGVYQVTDGNGVQRQIAPSCSGGPVCKVDAVTGQTSCREGNKQFSFYFKPGKEHKLLVFFDGGGACWDANTCITGNQTRLPAYVPELNRNSDPRNAGGLFDTTNVANPYRNWSVAVIPYCTGDIHWGSKDVSYTDFTGAATGVVGGQAVIHHRGFDNFLYVRDWLKKRYSAGSAEGEDEDESPINRLLVTGSSAGAYGAAFAYPHLKQAFPNAKGYLLGDGGNGVITDSLLQQAVQGDGRWGISQNLAHWIPGMNALITTAADRFVENYYFALAGYYRGDRFSQYTTRWDAVQTLFYNIMLNQNNIPAWGQLTPSVYGAWAYQMLNHLSTTSTSPNYRYYVGEGCDHTALRFSDDFYKTNSTQAVNFLSWFKALTKEEHGGYPSAWQNSYCVGCETPPTQQAVSACFQRSFAR